MESRPHLGNLLLTIFVAVVSVSFGSILVKWNTEAPPLTIAFFRMLWAAVLLFPFYVRERAISAKRGRTALPLTSILLAGLGLALHFAFWITSLRHTSVAVSVFLVNTAPLMVALLAFLLWRERLTLAGAAGIVVAVSGAGCLSLSQFQSSGTIAGALYALLGAVFLSVYLTAGHASLRITSLWLYVYPTYLISALLLGLLVWVMESPVSGLGIRTHALMFLLGLVPQCLGHTSYNRILQYLSPTLVSLLLLGEPVGASVLAYVLLSESLSPLSLLGAGAVAVGVLLVSRGGIRTEPKQQIAVAVIRSQPGVFVQQREGDSLLEDFLEFPGGKIEVGESPLQAAIREAREECGLELDPRNGREIWQQSYQYPDRRVHIHFLLFDVPGEPPTASGSWVPEENLNANSFPPANRQVIDLLKIFDKTRRPASEADRESQQRKEPT